MGQGRQRLHICEWDQTLFGVESQYYTQSSVFQICSELKTLSWPLNMYYNAFAQRNMCLLKYYIEYITILFNIFLWAKNCA